MPISPSVTRSPAPPPAGRAPLVASRPWSYAHTDAGGFCSVCGSVWPCARSRAAEVTGKLVHAEPR